jgi:hypothetical protein
MADLAQTASQGLLTGFTATVESLPDIAAREITEREKDLAKTVGQVGANLGAEFAKKFKDRMVGLGIGINEDIGDINLNFDRGVMNDLRKFGMQPTQLQASESRLLTRGPGANQKTLADVWQVLQSMSASMATTAQNTGKSESELAEQTAIMQAQPQLAVQGIP